MQERYSRQVLFSGIGEMGQRKIREKHVLLIGAGALGAANAEALARMGIGKLTIADRDYVEWSNLQRQQLYTEEDAKQCKPKAIAAAEHVRKINFSSKVLYYGLDESNDIYAKNVVLNDKGSEFDLYINKELYGHFNLPLFGEHMVLNAIAAIAICNLEGVSCEEIKSLLSTFKNAKRRFSETVVNDTVIIDDYAHHPTEIKVTLEAARQKYPDKKIIAVFKPNTYSRTEKFYKEFANSLNIADKAYLTEIDCNREKKEDYSGVTSKVIFDLLSNGEMVGEEDIDKLLEYKGEVICFMSCASIAHMKENLINLLEK